MLHNPSQKIKDRIITILSYAENEFSIAGQNKPGANPIDLIDFTSKIQNLKDKSHFILLLYHGGKENYSLPTPNQQKLCRFFIDQGVDMVVCQHSHTPAVYENYNDGDIFYGQGNFIFDPYPLKKDWLYKGFLIELVIDKNYKNIRLIPFVHKSFLGNEVGIRKMKPDEEKIFINGILEQNKKMKDNPNFINDEWIKKCKSLENTYLSILNGNGRIMRKLNEKIPWLKILYRNKKKLLLKNIVTCETHHEIIKTILNENEK